MMLHFSLERETHDKYQTVKLYVCFFIQFREVAAAYRFGKKWVNSAFSYKSLSEINSAETADKTLRLWFRKRETQEKVTWLGIYTKLWMWDKNTDVIICICHREKYSCSSREDSVVKFYGLLFLDKMAPNSYSKFRHNKLALETPFSALALPVSLHWPGILVHWMLSFRGLWTHYPLSMIVPLLQLFIYMSQRP